MKKIPAIILNGFLGSGKTTLFRNLLGQAKKKNIDVYSIINDMSELDVDGELLIATDAIEEDEESFQSIHSCVLSSKKGIKKLHQAVQHLLSTHTPELLIIETSGSCHPMPLIEYFRHHKQIRLTGVFALVDCLMLSHDYDYGKELFPKMRDNLTKGKRDMINLLIEQLMFANHIFLTKSDRIEEGKLTEIASYIKNINPYASAHALLFGQLKLESLFELEEYNYHRVVQLIKELRPILDAESEGDRPYDFATRVIKDYRPFHPQRLWEICHKFLDKRIYRSKGFFWLASRDKFSLLWNQAAGSISLELIGSWRAGILEDPNNSLSEMEYKVLKERLADEPGAFGDRHCDLTVIGDKTQVDHFTEALRACFLTDEEIKLWKEGHQFIDPWPKNIVYRG